MFLEILFSSLLLIFVICIVFGLLGKLIEKMDS
jgi:hypothetical protein